MTQKKRLKLNFYEDPGHGWLEVPTKLLAELNIASEITPSSYQLEGYAYLEEDRDMTTFMMAVEKSARFSVVITTRYYPQAPVRNFPAYGS